MLGRWGGAQGICRRVPGRRSLAISGNQWQSVAISGNQLQSVAISQTSSSSSVIIIIKGCSGGARTWKKKSGSPSSSRSSESSVMRKSDSRPGSKMKGIKMYGVSLGFSKVNSASTWQAGCGEIGEDAGEGSARLCSKVYSAGSCLEKRGPLQSEAIRSNQRPPEGTRSRQRPSEAVRSHQKPSEAIRSHQKAGTCLEKRGPLQKTKSPPSSSSPSFAISLRRLWSAAALGLLPTMM